MIKQQDNKDTVYQYIVKTHQNNLKRYLDLAPRLNPSVIELNPVKADSHSKRDLRTNFSSLT